MKYILNSTDKFLFITVEKVASRFTTRLCGSSRVDVVFLDSTFDRMEFNKKGKASNDILERTIKDFEDFLSKTIKKNVIFLYRDPLNRIESGIIQDAFSLFYSINDYDINSVYRRMLIKNITSNYPNQKKIMKSVIDIAQEDVSDLKLKDVDHDVKKILKDILEIYISKSNSIGNSGHTQNYLYSYFILLNKNIDTNKVILCDIDDTDSFNKMIEQFNIESDGILKSEESHQIRKDILREVLHENPSMESLVNSVITEETIFYDILKSNKNNFTHG